MIYELHPRQSVIENVDRMINCGNPSYGGVMYGYIEQDPLLITLHNSIGKDASRMQSFVLEGVADKVISSNKKDYCKMPVVAVNNLKTISEKEIESEM